MSVYITHLITSFICGESNSLRFYTFSIRQLMYSNYLFFGIIVIVFLLIDIPMARWDVKKWIKKEKERNANETYKVRRKC